MPIENKEAEATAQAEKSALEAARNLEDWKIWRASTIQPEPSTGDKNAARISIRLPGGDRLVRKFNSSLDIEEIYAYVQF